MTDEREGEQSGDRTTGWIVGRKDGGTERLIVRALGPVVCDGYSIFHSRRFRPAVCIA